MTNTPSSTGTINQTNNSSPVQPAASANANSADLKSKVLTDFTTNRFKDKN